MNTVQHIAFNCTDVASQEQFYTRHFGFRRVRTFNAGQPNEFIMLRAGTTCIELFPADSAAIGGEQEVGFKHIAFEVPDINAAAETLKAEGVDMGDIADCSHIVPGMSVCFFNDPDGNRIELVQGYADEE